MDEIIHILINQFKYNAPRQYPVDTAAQIRRMTADEASVLLTWSATLLTINE